MRGAGCAPPPPCGLDPARGRGADSARPLDVNNGGIFVSLTLLKTSVFRFGLAGLIVACITAPAPAQTFQTTAPYALLMDYDTRTVLFEKAADDLMAPASTAKIMTAEIVFHEITEGRLKLDDEFTISENAWRKGGASAGGSSMFAALNSRVRIEDLIKGLVIQSGNDAAIALAEGIAGSEENFAAMMTKRARQLGLQKSTFTNPWGRGDPAQKVTAREMAFLSAHVIEAYPELYKYFGEKEFTWNKVRQLNRNPLLTMDLGADGLKTGNIEESGFGLVGAAKQGEQRLIVVVNGSKTAKDRADEARKLIQWGMRAFESKVLFQSGDVIGTAKMFGGDSADVQLVAKGPVKVLIPRGSGERISAKIVYDGPIQAPVEEGVEIARLKVTRGSVLALDLPLRTKTRVGVGPLWRRAFDAGYELTGTLIRKNLSKN